MEQKWIPTTTDVEAYDCKGNPIFLENVPALKNEKTGSICVDASEVAKAEFNLISKEHGLEPRDLPLIAMLFAKPGIFKEGEVTCKYNLNKMLFYQWKNMEKEYGLGEAFPHDDFRPAGKGPIPVHLWDDSKRLEKCDLVTLSYYKWGKTKSDASLTTKLTSKGRALAEKLWCSLFPEFREVTLKTKEDIFPLDPETVKNRVHKEYPEYASNYTETDRE